MDAVTEAVRAMYSAFPYPSGPPKLRQGTDPRLLLSYVRRARPVGAPIRVLDAGCGRGVGLLAAASLAPEVEFLGVDLCRRSLDHVSGEVERRGLANVRLAEVDLMTLDGLDVPTGGFDVVLSSGVLHHLADPDRGLAGLRAVLAEHGVLSLMVYGRHGREALYRVVRAIDALVPRGAPLEQRLALGRELVASVQSEVLDASPWDDLERIDDTEFVDRYLNVHETSYDVPGLFELVRGAGLEFLRWAAPEDWDAAALAAAPRTAARVEGLAPEARFALIDALRWRPSLEVLLTRPGNGPRAPFDPERAEDERLAWSPEATLQVERRHLAQGERVESVAVRVRRGEPRALSTRTSARVALLLEGQTEAFALETLVRAAAVEGLARDATLAATAELIALEALFRPRPD